MRENPIQLPVMRESHFAQSEAFEVGEVQGSEVEFGVVAPVGVAVESVWLKTWVGE